MAGEDDLVSKVTVEGTEDSAAKLNTYADQGAKAFEKLDKAANKAAADIKQSTGTIEKSTANAAQQIQAFAQTRVGSALVGDLGRVESGAKNLVTAIRSGIPAIASFVTRLTAAGAGAVAAGVGILKLASNVVKASTTASSAIDKQTEAQVNANNAQLQGEIATINLESSQRKLFQQFQRGEISFSQYSAALRQLNLDFREQQRVAAQTEAAQERVRLENERLQKQAADTKAFQAQIDIFGGPLLSSLIQLGNQANALFQDFKNTFGPAVAAGIDLISNSLAKNGTSISAFFSEASKKVAEFLTKNGPAIEQAFSTIGTAIKAVFDGIINALPGLLSFFNDSLVPALKAFGAVLDTVAVTINTIFGTQLTGGAIVFLVILGQMTGAFVALINVVRLFAAALLLISGLPFGAVLLAIAAAIGVLLFFFPQLRQVALDVLNSILTAFQGMLNGAQQAGQGIISAFGTLISFFKNLFAQIGQLFVDGWTLVVTGVTTAVEAVKTAWNTTVDFFKTLTANVGQFFTDMWQGIVNAFNTAVATITGVFNQLLATAQRVLQPILDLLQAIASLAASVGGSTATTPVAAAGGGHIRGPGTATSDSIPAWLSDGEFVIKARSVAKYGLGLLTAINQGRFRMPRFNVGGLVSSMISPTPRLAYADGGEVKNPATLRPINLSLFGEEFNGLLAPEDVGERLTKFAVQRGNRSAGRKPAWLGRGRN